MDDIADSTLGAELEPHVPQGDIISYCQRLWGQRSPEGQAGSRQSGNMVRVSLGQAPGLCKLYLELYLSVAIVYYLPSNINS